ncbi:MAG: aspartate aminotransferase family protein [Chloroflexota bacterium]
MSIRPPATRVPTDRDFTRSAALYATARNVIAGGVTSAVRGGELPHPLYLTRGEGPFVWDVDGNQYVDYALGYGPLILGHSPHVVTRALKDQLGRALTFGAQHELEPEVAALLAETVPGAEQAIFSTTGSEAVAAAIRIARAVTGRTRVLKFEGHYHGWLDGIAASTAYDRARSGDPDRPVAVPSTGGVSPAAIGEIVVAPWNDLAAFREIVAAEPGHLAAVILEPVLVNGGLIPAAEGFLEGVRDVTREAGTLLVFDEVITGFRVALGGAQARCGVTADLAVFAKAMAGGVPISAVTGSRRVMAVVADGTVAHNGTFNGNPLATVAAAATIRHLRDEEATVYPMLERLGDLLAAALRDASPRLTVRSFGPIVHTAVDEPATVRSIRDRASGNPGLHARFIERLLHHGVHATPRGLWYVSTAHTPRDIEATAAAAAAAAREAIG